MMMDEEEPALPPILIQAHNQSHLLTVVGVESSMMWDNITIELSPEECHHDAPTTGHMVPGQTAHLTAPDGTECTLTAAYDGVEIDSWVFTFEAATE